MNQILSAKTSNSCKVLPDEKISKLSTSPKICNNINDSTTAATTLHQTSAHAATLTTSTSAATTTINPSKSIQNNCIHSSQRQQYQQIPTRKRKYDHQSEVLTSTSQLVNLTGKTSSPLAPLNNTEHNISSPSLTLASCSSVPSTSSAESSADSNLNPPSYSSATPAVSTLIEPVVGKSDTLTVVKNEKLLAVNNELLAEQIVCAKSDLKSDLKNVVSNNNQKKEVNSRLRNSHTPSRSNSEKLPLSALTYTTSSDTTSGDQIFAASLVQRRKQQPLRISIALPKAALRRLHRLALRNPRTLRKLGVKTLNLSANGADEPIHLPQCLPPSPTPLPLAAQFISTADHNSPAVSSFHFAQRSTLSKLVPQQASMEQHNASHQQQILQQQMSQQHQFQQQRMVGGMVPSPMYPPMQQQIPGQMPPQQMQAAVMRQNSAIAQQRMMSGGGNGSVPGTPLSAAQPQQRRSMDSMSGTPQIPMQMNPGTQRQTAFQGGNPMGMPQHGMMVDQPTSTPGHQSQPGTSQNTADTPLLVNLLSNNSVPQHHGNMMSGNVQQMMTPEQMQQRFNAHQGGIMMGVTPSQQQQQLYQSQMLQQQHPHLMVAQGNGAAMASGVAQQAALQQQQPPPTPMGMMPPQYMQQQHQQQLMMQQQMHQRMDSMMMMSNPQTPQMSVGTMQMMSQPPQQFPPQQGISALQQQQPQSSQQQPVQDNVENPPSKKRKRPTKKQQQKEEQQRLQQEQQQLQQQQLQQQKQFALQQMQQVGNQSEYYIMHHQQRVPSMNMHVVSAPQMAGQQYPQRLPSYPMQYNGYSQQANNPSTPMLQAQMNPQFQGYNASAMHSNHSQQLQMWQQQQPPQQHPQMASAATAQQQAEFQQQQQMRMTPQQVGTCNFYVHPSSSPMDIKSQIPPPPSYGESNAATNRGTPHQQGGMGFMSPSQHSVSPVYVAQQSGHGQPSRANSGSVGSNMGTPSTPQQQQQQSQPPTAASGSNQQQIFSQLTDYADVVDDLNVISCDVDDFDLDSIEPMRTDNSGSNDSAQNQPSNGSSSQQHHHQQQQQMIMQQQQHQMRQQMAYQQHGDYAASPAPQGQFMHQQQQQQHFQMIRQQQQMIQQQMTQQHQLQQQQLIGQNLAPGGQMEPITQKQLRQRQSQQNSMKSNGGTNGAQQLQNVSRQSKRDSTDTIEESGSSGLIPNAVKEEEDDLESKFLAQRSPRNSDSPESPSKIPELQQENINNSIQSVMEKVFGNDSSNGTINSSSSPTKAGAGSQKGRAKSGAQKEKKQNMALVNGSGYESKLHKRPHPLILPHSATSTNSSGTSSYSASPSTVQPSTIMSSQTKTSNNLSYANFNGNNNENYLSKNSAGDEKNDEKAQKLIKKSITDAESKLSKAMTPSWAMESLPTAVPVTVTSNSNALNNGNGGSLGSASLFSSSCSSSASSTSSNVTDHYTNFNGHTNSEAFITKIDASSNSSVSFKASSTTITTCTKVSMPLSPKKAKDYASGEPQKELMSAKDETPNSHEISEKSQSKATSAAFEDNGEESSASENNAVKVASVESKEELLQVSKA